MVSSAEEEIIINEKKARLNPFKRRSMDIENRTIGIFGLGQGVGTTHISLLLAVYLSQIKGSKVSILEYSGKEDLAHLEEQYVTKRADHLKSFWLGDILCNKSVSQDEIGKLRNAGRNYYIFDLGCGYGQAWEELLRCDSKIIIGSPAAWHRMDKKRFFIQSEDIKNWDNWSFIENLSEERMKTENMPMKEFSLGFSPNLLRMSDSTIRIFYQILH